MRAVGVLAIALVCAMGMAQAVHAHPENAAASHHACSICVAAHAGLRVEAGAAAPMLITAALAMPGPKSCGVFRPAATHFIRPPPGA